MEASGVQPQAPPPKLNKTMVNVMVDTDDANNSLLKYVGEDATVLSDNNDQQT